ncbi:MAG: HAD hydrolase-like protein [Gammaproteobacteria bacterium]|nr:HAD hydrolase-like protein [Gammaproteobacteria bacterium]
MDGTVSDPSEGIWKSVNYAMIAFGYAELPRDTFSQYIGPPIDQTFRTVTGSDDETEVLELVSKFRERYSRIGFSENQLYPEIPDVLRDLVDSGHTLGLCTGKRVDFAERILELFGLSEFFDFVDGGDVGISKSMQLERLGRNGVDLGSSVMIGDRDSDILAGKDHNLVTVGVLWGFGSRTELEKARPTHLARKPAALIELSNLF